MPDSSELAGIGTIVTLVSTDRRRLTLRADYFESPIDLNKLQANYADCQILNANPLVLLLPHNAHAVVLPFGAVVFWQCAEADRAEILKQIQALPDTAPPSDDVPETHQVLVDQAEDRVNFRDIWLQHLTLEHIKIISENFGRSVAFKHSERAVNRAMKQTTPIVHALEARGELFPSAKSILKTVGFTLAVREAVLAKLSLFEAPAETSRSERLSRLHDQLHDHFGLKKRLTALQEKLTFLSDLNVMLLTLLQNRTSHRLEWIVILLIVIEVLFSFMHAFMPFH